MRSLSLYVHIPFCAARCPYCDFATAPARSPLRARYLETLAREIALRGAELGRPRLRTVYFGGGTPSLLEPAEVDALATALGTAFELRPVEVTLEANPATLDAARLWAFRRIGLDRVSLGAQSLDPAGLRALARTHAVEDVARSVALAREAGVRSVNLDLIFGWPGSSREAWRADLERAVALGPDHLSCYPLTLAHEPESSVPNWPGRGWPALARWRADAAARQPDDDALADMYQDAERALGRAGFAHYEIANWARPGHRSRHNLVYWRSGEWLGVGLGAHSHLAGRRSWNDGRLERYLERYRGDASVPDGRDADTADQPDRERARPSTGAAGDDVGALAAEPWETAMLALRTSEGVTFAALARRHGAVAAAEIGARLRSLDGSGLLRLTAERARLTRRGRLLANEVFVRLI